MSTMHFGIADRLARPWDWADYAALRILAERIRVFDESETPVVDALEKCEFDLEDERFRQRVASILRDKQRLVTVCDACLKASCWRGLFLCDDYVHAGTIDLSVSTLREIGREDPGYWTELAYE